MCLYMCVCNSCYIIMSCVSLSMCVCVCVSNPSMQTWTWGVLLFLCCCSFFFLKSVSRICYQNDLWWTDNHSTGNWNCTKKNSLQHKSRENAAGNKCNWITLSCLVACVSFYVCVCVFFNVLWVSMFLYVCVLFVCVFVTGERIERGHRIPDHALARRRKSHLLTMYCCDTHICTNVKSWKAVKYMTPSISRLSIFRPVELYSLA